MRPNILNPLFAAITTLHGVGPRLEKLYRRLFGREQPARVIDLLFHLPTGAIDRRARPKLRDVVPDTVVTVAVTVDRHRPPPPHRPRVPYQVYTSDETGDLTLTYFNARRDYLQKLLPIGERRYVSGTIELYDHMLQMVHPDRVVAETDLGKLPLVEPVYPLTEGLSLNQVGKAADAALARLPDLPEWQEASWVARERFPPFADALRLLHRPSEPADLLPEGLAWSRLAYDEFLAGQLALALVRAHLRRPAGRATAGTGHIRKKLIEALPYSLTPSQGRAVADIVADLAKPERMLRLLQGDVGSGKTVVALLAAAAVIEGGRQVALMAPTEIWRGSISTPLRRSPPLPGSLSLFSLAASVDASATRSSRSSLSGTFTCWSAPTPCFRRMSRFATSRSPWSTNSTASACISALRSPKRARRSMCS